MGYMRHHAIVVSSCLHERGISSRPLIELAHDKAVELGMSVTGISGEDSHNGYRSFLVAPDGSKEGWGPSNRGDVRRAQFTEWLHSQRYDDDSTPIEWVEVQYGDDEDETKIIQDSDKYHRLALGTDVANARQGEMS